MSVVTWTNRDADTMARFEVSAMQHVLRLLFLALTLLLAVPALAAGQATPEEAKAMAIKAADYLRAEGADKAFHAFNVKEGPWFDRDLYVFVENDRGIMMMHGNNPSLAGRNVADLK